MKNKKNENEASELADFSSRLKVLNENLESIPFFQAKDTRSRMKRLLDIKGLFFKNFSLVPRKLLYLGYNKKIKEQKLPKKVLKNLKKLESLSRENSKLTTEQARLSLNLRNLKSFKEVYLRSSNLPKILEKLEEEIIKTPSNKDRLEKRIDEIKKLSVDLDARLQKMQLSSNEKENVDVLIQQYEEQLKRLSLKLKKLDRFKEVVFTNIKQLDEYKGHEKAGAKMRQDCEALGGKRITISTPDQTKLDGMFLDASAFRKKLSDCGCQMMTLTDENSRKELNGIYLSKKDYEKSGQEVLDALSGLHALHTDNEGGVGWKLIPFGSEYMIIQTRDLPQNVVNNKKLGNSLIEFDNTTKTFKIKEGFLYQTKFENIDYQSPSSGTVILSSGIAGVYEMHKEEAAFFLLKNMNVMMFNFRGYGNSEGIPSQKGLRLDMESAYQAAQKFSQHSDEQIVFKALCFSGPIAAYVASKHPKTNIILDQSFSDSKSLFKSGVASVLNINNKKTFDRRRNLVLKLSSVISFFVPKLSMSTAKYFSKNKGEKAIIYTQQDTLVTADHVEKIVKEVSASNQLQRLSLFSQIGVHDTNVISVHANIMDFSEKELKKIYRDVEGLQRELFNLNINISNLKKQKIIINEYINLHDQLFTSIKYKENLEVQKKDLPEMEDNFEPIDRIEKEIEGEEFNQQDLQSRIVSIEKESHFSIDQILTTFESVNSKIHELEIEIGNLRKKINSLLILGHELRDSTTKTPVGQNQIEHFLMKAHLMSHIIKPSNQVSYSD